ncbi:hypothetical protein COCNU_01G017240 [Cocos nucifera]|uniref:PCI domain-containing protein n=1 Tax=Cocos nucifera TaxID=13894 RepID=A0A8K0MVU4_COCNU|nr:hypothetical protein COCNU_01G017240 [Cocos nucifera]
MYNNQRKKGINVPTKKEFRGYYALHKLDKHLGYKVGPAEHSLDLAKMNPEIRCTSEILFARDVTRACRIGNYITFFRLARKATYLQACLMHAHFAKIRTKALAALHGGLQKNHGIPIAHVVDWLGMEEDVEGLLEYHGFVLKKYEELYMVKEGPFLNGEVDFPTKCAKLVHLKKSKRIIDDVYFKDEQMTELNGETSMGQGILPQTETTIVQAGAPGFSKSKLIVENTAPQTEVGKSLENEASKIILCHKNEVANEKMKLIGTVTMGQTDLLASRWLLSKLVGSGEENDEVVVSSSHLSIWKKWINRNSSSRKWVNRNSSSEACCLFVIREAMFVHKQPFAYDDIFAGASCIMFLVSKSIPWEIQRVRLQNLLMSVPSGSSLPLLMVVDDEYKEEAADPLATIIKRLGLYDVDKTRVNLFSVVFLVDGEHFGFFDDDKLREGLQWLANCSPLQPSLFLVKTYGPVSSYVRSSLRILDKCNASETGPDSCILAFNKALDQLVEEILTAASTNPICWPCPEVELLEKSSRERKMANMFLPSVGWSSPARIEPLIRALKGCKLPIFSDDLPFLSQDLLPGDVVSIGRSSGPSGEEKSVPADMLLLDGSALANEAILTGKSTPQWKVSIAGCGSDSKLSIKQDKSHILFGGTINIAAHSR